MIRCGGQSPVVDADESVQQICDQMKSSLEAKANRQFSEYTAISVCRQVVAGTNYFIKVHIGNEEYIHVRIFQPLPGQGDKEVHGFQLDKKKEDEISYF